MAASPSSKRDKSAGKSTGQASNSYTRIWQVVRDIPAGCVATYGQVAQLAGLPRAARLVGYALAASPEALDLPWHRVINAQGKISLPPSSDGYVLQRLRLEKEGVVFINGCIDLQSYAWETGKNK